MLLAIFSGLVVSVDAFFIGISLGMQKHCRYFHIVAINMLLFFCCILGYFFAEIISIPFETNLIVGFIFIALGLWTIFHFFRKETGIILVGLAMSGEAMIITMGITFVLPDGGFIIPVTVALAHFVYSSVTFLLSRTKYMKKIPAAFNHIISGLALIAYGLFAIFI